jgi:hypothetical protein
MQKDKYEKQYNMTPTKVNNPTATDNKDSEEKKSPKNSKA